jgi:transglutaminase-like putative cysteine protease
LSALYRIRHRTTYEYASDVVHSHQLLHLTPRPSPYQQCILHEIQIAPSASRRRDAVDPFGNPVTRIELEQPHDKLEVSADMEILVHPRPTALPMQTYDWVRTRCLLSYRGTEPALSDLEACRFRHESPYVRIKQVFSDFAADCFPSDTPILVGAEALMTKVHQELRYAPGETEISTPLLEILHTRRGVCQDFAHVMIACLRSLGLAARYVSGYVRIVRTDAAPARIGIGQSHAWVAVYCPPLGWIELDPTNDARVGTDHVAVAWGRDFGDVSPLRGVILGGGAHELSVAVTVEALTP